MARSDEQATDFLNLRLGPTWISRGVDILLKFKIKLVALRCFSPPRS
jgi:hypothetical protein